MVPPSMTWGDPLSAKRKEASPPIGPSCGIGLSLSGDRCPISCYSPPLVELPGGLPSKVQLGRGPSGPNPLKPTYMPEPLPSSVATLPQPQHSQGQIQRVFKRGKALTMTLAQQTTSSCPSDSCLST
ncbi:hypothetical protein BHE74_00051615 [Ensete ventricosum]|nr:hypothetical protein BHE74_00051615 [Ensete ventricosum]